MKQKFAKKIRIALICGGPSLERGISLNSARSVLDHLAHLECDLVPIYISEQKHAYVVSPAQLYSNTPSDFDFKLHETAKPLTLAQLMSFLKKHIDIVFPVMHGPFGEDGTIQAILERHAIPFVGSSSSACKQAFDKHKANEYIRSHGFFAPETLVLKIYDKSHSASLVDFFRKHSLKRAIVKPATGGSSIGVFSVSSAAEALEKVELLFSKRMDTRVVVEPFAEGTEFTVIILQNRFGLPVAILPTEIETDYSENQIFDFRRKYLPTRHVTYHCPPRFSHDVMTKIQIQAEQLFTQFGMRDFARFDGWLLRDGTLWFSDFNPISGMEQNSFLFQQSSRIGLTHADVLENILKNACKRYGLVIERRKQKSIKRKDVAVLFGGKTSERQVSLMSGTNVWLKLKQSERYNPIPYLLDTSDTVWKLPYAYALNHTVEEIVDNCVRAESDIETLSKLVNVIRIRLGLNAVEGQDTPARMTLDAFLDKAPYIFLALHGGDGEGGVLQRAIGLKRKRFNGSNTEVSKLCMDKYSTNRLIQSFNIPGVATTQGVVVQISETSITDIAKLWNHLKVTLDAESIVIKPRADGCSSGVVHLRTAKDLGIYIACVQGGVHTIPAHTFSSHGGIVEMPVERITEVLCEKFVSTDVIKVRRGDLHHERKSGYVEITVAVLEHAGKVTALSPSITVADGEVLSLEEKFQGGTGVNITPPPQSLVRPHILNLVKKHIATVAKKVGIQGYARIDAFMHCDTGNIIIIEINTLPGLTPSTVLYHQGLAESPQIFPCALLEQIIKNSGY